MEYQFFLLPAAKFLVLLIGSVIAIVIGWIRLTRATKRILETRNSGKETKSSLKKLLSNRQSQLAQGGLDVQSKKIASYDLPPQSLGADQSPEISRTFLQRNLHVIMFLSLSPGLVLTIYGTLGVIYLKMMHDPPLAGQALLFLPYLVLPWVILIGLAMLPFGYDSEYELKLSELFFLLPIAALTAMLFSGVFSREVLLFKKYFLVYLYYVVTMSIYGTVYWLRSRI